MYQEGSAIDLSRFLSLMQLYKAKSHEVEEFYSALKGKRLTHRKCHYVSISIRTLKKKNVEKLPSPKSLSVLCKTEGGFVLAALSKSQLSVIFLKIFFGHSVVSNSLRPHGLQHARLPCSSLNMRLPILSSSCWPQCTSQVPFSPTLFF